jgi:flagellum-specific peptidoglycan hydrolase FlgJ
MAKVKSKSEMDAMDNVKLAAYLESIDDSLYDGYIDPDTKVRYFLYKYGAGVAKGIKGTDIFFPAIIAQAIIESGYGRSIPKDSNNFGGIKYNPNLQGVVGYVLSDTSEIIKGKKVFVKAKFSKFKDAEAGFKAHVNVWLLDRYKNALKSAKTPEEQIINIAKAGYTTTDPSIYLKGIEGNIKRVREKTGFGKII